MDEVFPIVLDTLRTHDVTDCFVILNNGKDGQDTLYLRDMDPLEDSVENSDIVVVAGSSKAMFEAGLTLDSLWTESFRLEEDAKEIYEQSLETGNTYDKEDSLKLGHYSKAFRFRKNDLQVISYMIPLLDEEHHAVGVLGVALSLNYLQQVLDSAEIGLDEQASYCIGIREGEQVTVVLTEGGKFRSVYSPGTGMQCVPKGTMNMLPDAEACMYDRELHLYNTNAPFEEEHWFLGGIVREESLKASSGNLLTALLIAVTVSFLISILGAYWVTGRMTKPLNMLMEGVQNITPGQISLPRTNVYEIDELAEALEKQSEKAIREGAKMADIISMSNLKLGIMEYDKESDAVFFAGKLLEMLELPADIQNGSYIESDKVRDLLVDVSKRICKEEEEENIYGLTHADGSVLHIHVIFKETEKEVIYICQDMTETINEKKKIRHDRDCDALTDLYNRGAFYRRVNHLITENKIVAGVMAVWDLDNLKYVNDSYGHNMGDRYICLMADTLKKYQDEHCIVSRRSGDEYMVFVYGEDVTHIREMIVSMHYEIMKQRIVFKGGQIHLSASGGMAVYGKDGVTYEELLNNADFAMYESKRKQKGGIWGFDQGAYQKDQALMENAEELDRIISEESIGFTYEPIISVTDKKVVAYESLPHPISHMIESQTDLQRLAESRSKLHPLENVILHRALTDFLGQQSVPDHTVIFVDLIANEFPTESEWGKLEERFHHTLNRLVLGLVENARADREVEETGRQFCVENQIRLALKLPGADYNHIEELNTRGFGFIKLNVNSFYSTYDERTGEEAKRMIAACHDNAVKVIADGIKSHEQFEMMIQMGVDYVQGSYFTENEFDFAKSDYADAFV
ncbi:MAG: diguanylate cyclase [Clostridium sp.]|nr:diguanylate cyclase [Clostridium sp.]